MILRLLLALLPLFVGFSTATAASHTATPVSAAVANWHRSGTATVDDTDIPALLGISCPAIWGEHDGKEFIAFINPETGGMVIFVDGENGVTVDIQSTDSFVDLVSISDGASFIDCTCVSP